MLPPPEGLWGMPPEMLKTLPGYDPDVQKNRAEARADHGEARLRARQAARGHGVDAQHPAYRDPAVILIDQLKEIYIDGELDIDRHRSTGIPRSCARTTRVGAQRQRERPRRPRPDILRELRLRCGTQLYRLLQSGSSTS